VQRHPAPHEPDAEHGHPKGPHQIQSIAAVDVKLAIVT
jgi:hypothetical protein